MVSCNYSMHYSVQRIGSGKLLERLRFQSSPPSADVFVKMPRGCHDPLISSRATSSIVPCTGCLDLSLPSGSGIHLKSRCRGTKQTLRKLSRSAVSGHCPLAGGCCRDPTGLPAVSLNPQVTEISADQKIYQGCTATSSPHFGSESSVPYVSMLPYNVG